MLSTKALYAPNILFLFSKVTPNSDLNQIFPGALKEDNTLDIARICDRIRTWRLALDKEFSESVLSPAPTRLVKIQSQVTLLSDRKVVTIIRRCLTPLNNSSLGKDLDELDTKIKQIIQMCQKLVPAAFEQNIQNPVLRFQSKSDPDIANFYRKITRSQSAPSISMLPEDYHLKRPVRKRKETDAMLFKEFKNRQAKSKWETDIRDAVFELAKDSKKSGNKSVIEYFTKATTEERAIIVSFLNMEQAKVIFFHILELIVRRDWMRTLIYNLQIDVFGELILGLDPVKVKLLNRQLHCKTHEEHDETFKSFKKLGKALVNQSNGISSDIDGINDEIRWLQNTQSVEPGVIEQISDLQCRAMLGKELAIRCQSIFENVFKDLEYQELLKEIETAYIKYEKQLSKEGHQVVFADSSNLNSSIEDTLDGSPWSILMRKSLSPIDQVDADDDEDEAIDYIYKVWHVYGVENLKYVGLLPESAKEPTTLDENCAQNIGIKKLLDEMGLKKRSDLVKNGIINKETLRWFMLSQRSGAASSSCS